MMKRWKSVLSALMLFVMVTTMPAAAAPIPPPTLTGETLHGQRTETGPPVVDCSNGPVNPGNPDLHSGTTTYTMSGTATGAYPGPFTEKLTLVVGPGFVTQFHATFIITAPTGIVSGSMSLTRPSGGGCVPAAIHNFIFGVGDASYTATIATVTGNYHDEGTVFFNIVAQSQPDAEGATNSPEMFTSSLTQTVLLAPTIKEQCKDGGWKNFGTMFKNQGECVAYVNHH